MGPGTPITAEEAGEVFRKLPRHSRTIAALARELVRRQTPVSVTTLTVWKRHRWRTPMSKQKVRPKYRMTEDRAKAAVRRIGLDPAVVEILKKELKDKSDAELVRETTRNLFINANLLMAHAQHQAPDLLQEDPRGLAAVFMAAFHMVEGGNQLMRDSVELAERALKANALAFQEQHQEQQTAPALPDGGPSPFSDIAYRFGLERLPPDHRTKAEVLINGNGRANGHTH